MRHFRNARHPGMSESRAFTLVELLVVVGIIALLVTILMPSLGRALELTRRVKCALNLSNMGRAWIIYFSDNGDQFPGTNGQVVKDPKTKQLQDPYSQTTLYIASGRSPTNTWYLWKAGLLQDPNVFVCPTTDKSVPYPTWFTNPNGPPDREGAYSPYGSPNDWPPGSGNHCRMT